MKFKILAAILMPLFRAAMSSMASGAMWGVGYFITEKIWKKKDKSK